MRMIPGCAAVLLLACGAACAKDQAPVYTPYPINGSTAAELDAQMQALGPRQHDGARYPGGAQWQISWEYSSAPHGARCRLGQLRVKLTSNITLPHWQQRSQADDELGAAWDAFLVQLELHEQGHVQHGREAAEDIRRALTGLSGSCSTLDQQAAERGKQIIAAYSQRDIEYDAQTRHGQTQGAVLAY